MILLTGFSEKPEPGFLGQNCPEVFVDIPAPELLEVQQTSLLCSETFALSFSFKTKTPLWVVERLQAQNLAGRADRKFSKFKPDPRLLPENQASLNDYRKSGYDRGHMAPAANLKFSQKAMDQSFFLSNIAPQVGVGFNRGIWRQLEEHVRAMALERGELYVITGPVYYDFTPVIGKNKIVVPDAFFKIIYDPELLEVVAFLMPNKEIELKDFNKFLIGVAALEDLTGINFSLKSLS